MICYLIVYTKKSVEVGHSAQEHYYRAQHHYGANDLIDEANAIVVKLAANLVYQPCQSKPPQQCSKDDAHESYHHFKRMVRHYKSKLGKARHKKENDQWVGKRDEEGGHSVVEEGSLPVARSVYLLRRIRLVCVNAKRQQHYATHYL